MILLQYRRTKPDECLELWINKTGIWFNYKQSKYYIPESKLYSSQSGFHTAQFYLKMGAKFLPIKEEDYRVPEEE
jgi:hypothetical protein